jgi:hypothetical protein
MMETEGLSPMTSHSNAPMARVAAALSRAWADTQTASRLLVEQQRPQVRPVHRAR